MVSFKEALGGKKLFFNPDGKLRALDTHDAYYEKGRLKSAGPHRFERNLDTGFVEKYYDEQGQEHMVEYDNSRKHIVRIGEKEVKPGEMDWLNE